jgi:hypothetical protein
MMLSMAIYMNGRQSVITVIAPQLAAADRDPDQRVALAGACLLIARRLSRSAHGCIELRDPHAEFVGSGPALPLVVELRKGSELEYAFGENIIARVDSVTDSLLGGDHRLIKGLGHGIAHRPVSAASAAATVWAA